MSVTTQSAKSLRKTPLSEADIVATSIPNLQNGVFTAPATPPPAVILAVVTKVQASNFIPILRD